MTHQHRVPGNPDSCTAEECPHGGVWGLGSREQVGRHNEKNQGLGDKPYMVHPGLGGMERLEIPWVPGLEGMA